MSLFGEEASLSEQVSWKTEVPVETFSAILALYRELVHAGVTSFTSVT